MGKIEQDIMDDIQRRLKAGRDTYGEFKDEEPRDMLLEAYEEALDCSVYLARAIQLLRIASSK